MHLPGSRIRVNISTIDHVFSYFGFEIMWIHQFVNSIIHVQLDELV